MDRQTLRDWVHRYNAEGISGLFARPHPGRPSRLTAEQKAEVAQWVRQGPKLSEDGVVRWRLIDLARKIEKQFGVRLAERSVGTLVRRLGFRRLSVRPHHPRKDAGAQEAFKKTFLIWSPAASRRTRAASRSRSGGRMKPVSVSQGTLTRIWAKRGSRPPAPRDQRYDWAYLFGAVCPTRGAGAALVLPDANAEAMNLHLAEIARQVAPESHAVVVLDRAGWHQSGGKLRLPDNLSLLPLPSYSPELNPMENVWEFLRQNKLSIRVFDDYDAIVDACCDAWNDLTADPQRIASIATRPWASVTQ
jgi:transposase